eukprot:GHVR01100741.1.p1 GENE.GHVR01100741.1~~GHVR01100741.1.p1  ORF type:complete len:110 (+),score=3.94 GHVR01100741.1:2710-3039(+)
MINDYLVGLFKKGDSAQIHNALKRYIEESVLLKADAGVKLSRGEEVKDLEQIFSTSEIQSLKEKKEITLLSKNKQHFKVNDDVRLSVNIKNVTDVTIKIYELNLEKYYL